MRSGRSVKQLRSISLVLVPVSLVLGYHHAPAVWVFATAAAAVIPLAQWIQMATEQLALRAGPAIGGLLTVTMGNAAELIVALFILYAGRPDVVKATITGSIIGNTLLGLGVAILAGSRGREKQTFKRERAGLLGSLLILSVIGLLVPALFDYMEQGFSSDLGRGVADERLSLGVSAVLILIYACNLIYTLVTHRDVFSSPEAISRTGWPLGKSLAVLVAATAATAFEADLIAGALSGTASRLGISALFIGIIVLPIIGNAGEYSAALYFAREDQMGTVMSIAVGSGIQIALLMAPVLVLVSYVFGRPMNLVFNNPLELIAIGGAAFAVNSIAQDGETTWFEGLLLLAVYVLLALAFFFVTPI